MTSENSKDKETIPHSKHRHNGFALYAVVQSELTLAASRAIAVYHDSITIENFLVMARAAYTEAVKMTDFYCRTHTEQGGCSYCNPEKTSSDK
jgi:hypothetical protein